MKDIPHGRALVNELTTLLERINPQALVSVTELFPQYADEIQRGPDAGTVENDRNYIEDRAKLASALCSDLVPAIYEAADRIIERAASINSARLAVGIIAGLGGASTLASLGVGKEEVTRIAGIVTSAIAVLNAGLDSLSKRYSASETQKAVDLKKAALQLSQLRRDLDLKVLHRREVGEISESIEKTNQIAFELNQKKDQLRLV